MFLLMKYNSSGNFLARHVGGVLPGPWWRHIYGQFTRFRKLWNLTKPLQNTMNPSTVHVCKNTKNLEMCCKTQHVLTLVIGPWCAQLNDFVVIFNKKRSTCWTLNDSTCQNCWQFKRSDAALNISNFFRHFICSSFVFACICKQNI